MKFHWVFAHPEPRSLNASLRDETRAALRSNGHDVMTSDLYEMDWNPVVTRGDYSLHGNSRFNVGRDSGHAYAEDGLAEVIAAIPFRGQNGGDYDHDLVLHDHVETGEAGLRIPEDHDRFAPASPQEAAG